MLSWWLTRALVFDAHEAADAPCVRRSARPLLNEGEASLAKLGRSAPRDREGVSALIAADFDGLFDMRIRC